MPAAIVVDSVSKRFRLRENRPGSLKEKVTQLRFEPRREFWALSDVSLTVAAGSVFGLIGHNGSGKSTLLRLVAGIYRPTSGSVAVDGRVSALLELGAGFHPDLTGRENIYLNSAILGLSARDTSRLIENIIDFSGLREFIDNPIKHYSSGMYVRLGFAVAVHVNPQILAVDEVIAVGDAEFQRRCFDHLRRLRKQGVTIVLVTHSMGVVESLCDEVAWLDHGKLQRTGTPELVTSEYLGAVGVSNPIAVRSETQESTSCSGPIERLELVDELGREVKDAYSDDYVRVRIAVSPAEWPQRLTLSIYDDRNIAVARTVGVVPQKTAADERKPAILEYVVEHLPFGPGDYAIAISVTDTNGRVVDGSERQRAFRVQAASPAVGGLLDLGGRWSVNSPLETK